MRILLTNYMETMSPGGINTTVHRLARALSGFGHDTLVVQANPRNRPRSETVNGFRVTRLGGSWSKSTYGLDAAAFPSLIRCIRAWHPDVMNVHGLHSMFSAQVMLVARTRAPPVPIVFSSPLP